MENMKYESGNMNPELGGKGKPEDLKERTKNFALRTIKLYGSLPQTSDAQILGKQLLRSATSVGAHYREALRARSTAEYISKLQGGMQELEESSYWFELIIGSGIFTEKKMQNLVDEADQLMAILTTIVKKEKVKC